MCAIHNSSPPTLLTYDSSAAGGFIRTNLEILYWYTRTNTVGISTPGSALIAVSYVIYFVSDLWGGNAFNSEKDALARVLAILWGTYWSLLLAAMILKTILHIDRSNSFPFLRLSPASHQERASSRVESSGNPALKVAV